MLYIVTFTRYYCDPHVFNTKGPVKVYESFKVKDTNHHVASDLDWLHACFKGLYNHF